MISGDLLETAVVQKENLVEFQEYHMRLSGRDKHVWIQLAINYFLTDLSLAHTSCIDLNWISSAGPQHGQPSLHAGYSGNPSLGYLHDQSGAVLQVISP